MSVGRRALTKEDIAKRAEFPDLTFMTKWSSGGNVCDYGLVASERSGGAIVYSQGRCARSRVVVTQGPSCACRRGATIRWASLRWLSEVAGRNASYDSSAERGARRLLI
jgi:hypothetical protein